MTETVSLPFLSPTCPNHGTESLTSYFSTSLESTFQGLCVLFHWASTTVQPVFGTQYLFVEGMGWFENIVKSVPVPDFHAA